MSEQDSAGRETSATTGMALLLVGLGMWALHASLGVFANWTWAMLIGSAWVTAGGLLLFSDVRLYQGAVSPAEAYYNSGSDS